MDPLKDVFDGERPGHSLAELGRFSGLSRFGPTGNETLTFIYGDWRTPKRLGNMDEYLSKNYYKKPSYFITFLKKILYRIKTIIGSHKDI